MKRLILILILAFPLTGRSETPLGTSSNPPVVKSGVTLTIKPGATIDATGATVTGFGSGSGLTGGTSGHVVTASGATTIADSGVALSSLASNSGTVFNPSDYGAVANGSTNDAAAIQAALDAASSAGGGIVQLQSKDYRINSGISVPANVRLRGSNSITTRAAVAGINTATNGVAGGTRILVRFGSGGSDTATAAITLSELAAVEGLTMYWPDQLSVNTPPTTYPFAIRMNGYRCAVEKIEFINAYRGIDNTGGGCLIRDVTGDVLALGLRADQAGDVNHYEDIHFIDSWSSGTNAGTWQQANGTAYQFKRQDSVYASHISCFHYNIGVELVASATGDRPGAPYGTVTDSGFDGCNIGIRDVDTQTSGNMRFNSCGVIGNIGYLAVSGKTGLTILDNCGFWGVPTSTFLQITGGNVQVRNCNFAGANAPYAILVDGNANVDIRGNHFDAPQNTRTINITATGATGILFNNFDAYNYAAIDVSNASANVRTDIAAVWGNPISLTASAPANKVSLLAENTSATGYGDLRVKNGSVLAALDAFGSSFSTSGVFAASSVALDTSASGGLSLINEAGFLRFVTGGFQTTDEAMRVHASHGVSIGSTTDPSASNLLVGGKIGIGGASVYSPLEIRNAGAVASKGLLNIVDTSNAANSTSNGSAIAGWGSDIGSGSTGRVWYIGADAGALQMDILYQQNGPIVFYTNGSESGRINNTGFSGNASQLTALNASNLGSGTVAVGIGGTGLTSYAVGDLLYASGSTTLSKLADVATGNALISGGITTAPSYGKITSSHVDSTILTSGGALGTPSSGTVTNLTGTASININGTVGASTPGTGAFTTLTNTGAATNSKAGAASTPALLLSGVPFAGTGTTSFPLLYINDANATASSTLNTAGTYLGINGDGSQDLINALKDGTSQFKVDSAGMVSGAVFNASSYVQVAATVPYYINGRIAISSPATGVLALTNSGQNGFTRLNMGATSSASSSVSGLGFDAVNGLTLQSGAGTTTWNDPSTANSGTVANRYLFGIAAPTLTSTGTSVTDTVASTVYIGGAPTASTNTTITTPYALNVAAGVVKFGGGTVILPAYTVATLPSTAATGKVAGAMAYVTDATAPTYNGALTGGGSVVVPVFYDGTAWLSH